MDEEKEKYKLKLAAAFISEGKNLHAAQIYRKLIEEDGKEDFYFQLAELYEDMGFVNAGKNILNDLLQIKNNDDSIALFLGQFLLRNSKWFEAIEVLTPISTSNPLTEFLIGYAYLMLNEFELSKEYFTNYISAEDSSELKQEANLYLAKVEFELHNYNSALDYANKAKYLFSDFWELNLILAKVYYNLNMFAHAVTPIQKALKLNSKDSVVQEYAGKIYYQLQDYKKAEEFFAQCIELSSEVSAEIYTLLAKSFLKQMKSDEAKMFFDLALRVDPTYEPAIAAKVKLN
ncbi:MAG: tetratricopeptide repeat protein [Ignavibacteriaceae bacterium]